MRNQFIIPDKKIYTKFKLFFGSGLENFKSAVVMVATGKFSFDIIGFDEYCQKRLGYNMEQHGSLNSFVCKRYGNEAGQLITDLIHF